MNDLMFEFVLDSFDLLGEFSKRVRSAEIVGVHYEVEETVGVNVCTIFELESKRLSSIAKLDIDEVVHEFQIHVAAFLGAID